MKKILLIGILITSLIQANDMTEEMCNSLSQEAVEMRKAGEKKKANEAFIRLCADGCGKACSWADKRDNKKGCEAKIPYGFSCYDMSYDETDEKKKLALKKKGCEAGYTMGCDFLAGDFAREKNYGLALKYYNIGCDLGGDECCGNLGMIYARGDYGERNDKKAYEYWSKSVKLNPNNAQSKGNLKVLCKNNPVCK
ncbi:MAG TPA: sel1 repeat family protein [bacterium (Candidatus Stahlbacteria)]|nr:sel1 repeat family protein [Candidatus Stahlbacteria bacterium]